jgi:MFS family permease
VSRFVPWALVALCFTLGVASRSIADSFGIFVPSLQEAFGASRASVTAIYSFCLLVAGTGAPLAGWLADRFGLRTLTMTGIAAAALGTLSASVADQVWQLYLGLGLMMGFGSAALGGVLHSSLLGRWFPSHRLGTALALAWSSSGVGGILILPLAQYLIASAGYRHAYLVLGLSTASFLVLLAVLPWRRIEAGAPGIVPSRVAHPGGGSGPTVKEAMREWPFWGLGLAFMGTSLGIFSMAPQFMAYLTERGVDGAYAARALAVAGVLTPIGMVGFNLLADRGGRRIAAMLAYGCSLGGLGALALVRGPSDDLWLWLFVALFGCSVGSRGPMISTLVTLRYRGANLGRIYGLISVGMGLGGSLGAWIGGVLHDLTGDYTAVMIFSALSLLMAAGSLTNEAAAREKRAGRALASAQNN